MVEERWCKRCMTKTKHEVVNPEQQEYNPRGRSLYKCKRCGLVTSMRHLRPSSEVSY